ncbi:hypothetical protein VTN96DRAFT_3029 [Rasamsonia emersonii]
MSTSSILQIVKLHMHSQVIKQYKTRSTAHNLHVRGNAEYFYLGQSFSGTKDKWKKASSATISYPPTSSLSRAPDFFLSGKGYLASSEGNTYLFVEASRYWKLLMSDTSFATLCAVLTVAGADLLVAAV